MRTTLLCIFTLLATLSAGCGNPEGRPATPRGCDPGNCEGCCTAEGRCVLGTATNACGQFGAACSDCEAGTCVQSTCQPAATVRPYAEGSCFGAPVVGHDGGVEAQTTGYANHSSTFCGGQSTSDFVVEVDVPKYRRAEVKVTPLDPGFAPIVYAWSVCSGTSVAGQNYGCLSAPDAGAAVTYPFTETSDEPTWVVIDGDGTTGRFRAEVKVLGESCAAPLSTAPDAVEAAGSTYQASNDSAGSCGGEGADLVVEVPVTVRSNLRATVPKGGGDRVLYLRRSCESDELACITAASVSGTTVTLTANDLEPGTYYLWIDDDNPLGAIGDLSLSVTPVAPGDTCTNATPLQFSAGADGGTAQLVYDGSRSTKNQSLTCGQPTLPDTVFSFTTTRTFDLQTNQGSFTAVALRGGSCEGAELACGTRTIRVAALPPGDYWLVSQNNSSSADLTVRLSDPRPGDSCFAPHSLSFTGGTGGGDAFAQSTLLGSHDDTFSMCGGGSQDEVFQFTTTQVLDLRANATGSDFQPVMSLRTSCTSGELICSPGSAATAGSFAVGSLQPGSYWLWIDSATGGSQYSLSASLTPPVTADTCISPGTLTLEPSTDGGSPSAFVTDNTSSFFNNTTGSCGGSGSADAVYALTLSTAATVTATATGRSGLNPVVYIRDSCAGTELSCAVATTTSSTATTTASLPAGTHYIWVDGLGASAGGFDLVVTVQ